MKVTMLLADSAQAVDGKLFVLGGGWTFIPPLHPMALAIKIDVPWDQANRPHKLELDLMDTDGNPFRLPDGQAVKVQTTFEVGHPAGIPPGSALPASLAVNFGPIPLAPNTRYVWRLIIDGEGNPDWLIPFNTLSAQR